MSRFSDTKLQARIDSHPAWEYSGLGAQCTRCEIGITGITEKPEIDDVMWDCKNEIYFPSCDEQLIETIHDE